ncbi:MULTISPECIES: hypothetical protein [unclassified Megasphaera]|uniref:hypothetical protein n=1 Tax=unclassified Megasphaera TaxID=2626256 RepID=UPI000EBA6EBD|nr:hypothetical protein [Megasphaera sp. UBA4233]HAM04552.1 hypothetical protein [Megasphaera sp.]
MTAKEYLNRVRRQYYMVKKRFSESRRSAMKEAELFIKGKRAQMTLDIEAETPAQKLKGGVA